MSSWSEVNHGGGNYCDGKVSGGAKYSSSCDHVNEDEDRRGLSQETPATEDEGQKNAPFVRSECQHKDQKENRAYFLSLVLFPSTLEGGVES